MNDSEKIDDLLDTSKIAAEDTIMLDPLFSFTQLVTSIACRSTDGLGEWCSSFFTSPPEKFCGLAEMKVKISITIEGFFELFFTNKILDFIYTLTTKKQKEKMNAGR
ncbi:hypothetical protein CDIK_4176 [Cucumispora dikerogammari]|nr:hypothetical protein CDIK_4176 [Cucumispora dikerogammari]